MNKKRTLGRGADAGHCLLSKFYSCQSGGGSASVVIVVHVVWKAGIVVLASLSRQV